MDKDKSKSYAYKAGYIFATIIALCLSASIVGLTIKFLFWLF